MLTPFQIKNIADQALKNVIINGNFDFWQRGTTAGTIGSGSTYSGPDRFGAAQSLTAGTGMTVSRSTAADVPTFAQSGYQSNYSAIYTNGTAATIGASDYQIIFTRLEGLDYATIHAKKVRLQFWVKTSVAGTYYVSFRNGTRSYIAPYTITSPQANSWQKINIDLTMDTFAGYAFDNTQGINITWALSAGSGSVNSSVNQWLTSNAAVGATQAWGATAGATFQIAQVALFAGRYDSNTVTTFSRAGRNIQEELAKCQRYYEKSYDIDVNPGTSTFSGMTQIGTGANTSGLFAATATFAVPKRSTPTIVIYDDAGNSSKVTAIAQGTPTSNQTINATNFSTRNARVQATFTTQSGLMFHWTADAEL